MNSIEWLIEQFNLQAYTPHIEKAKEMHKQEITDAYSAGEDNIDNDGCSISRNGKETYYQETFKQDL